MHIVVKRSLVRRCGGYLSIAGGELCLHSEADGGER
jgi:hypothetical protein